jgi:hypothetical protein
MSKFPVHAWQEVAYRKHVLAVPEQLISPLLAAIIFYVCRLVIPYPLPSNIKRFSCGDLNFRFCIPEVNVKIFLLKSAHKCVLLLRENVLGVFHMRRCKYFKALQKNYSLELGTYIE